MTERGMYDRLPELRDRRHPVVRVTMSPGFARRMEILKAEIGIAADAAVREIARQVQVEIRDEYARTLAETAARQVRADVACLRAEAEQLRAKAIAETEMLRKAGVL